MICHLCLMMERMGVSFRGRLYVGPMTPSPLCDNSSQTCLSIVYKKSIVVNTMDFFLLGLFVLS